MYVLMQGIAYPICKYAIPWFYMQSILYKILVAIAL